MDSPAVAGGAHTFEYPELSALEFCRALFIGRIPTIDVDAERDTAIARLKPHHQSLLMASGFSADHRAGAEQVHGNRVAVVTKENFAAAPYPGADALVTTSPGICLGIYVADCAALFFADPRQRAIGLAHSGKKGTELNITAETVRTMTEHFGTDPRDLTVVISPCIRPLHYEVDFASAIAEQCRACGVGRVFDSGACTASDLARFYSYRIERGRTGRMLAAFEIIG